jgi:transcriptional regulator with PAS, ATPase and Fis domain
MSAVPDWVTTFPGAVTVSDENHTVIYMNDAAAATWEAKGGRELVGKNLLACHNENSQAIIKNLLATGGSNAYTIEKNGVNKLIYQTAWRDSTGKVAGLAEVSLVLPEDMQHFVRN